MDVFNMWWSVQTYNTMSLKAKLPSRGPIIKTQVPTLISTPVPVVVDAVVLAPVPVVVKKALPKQAPKIVAVLPKVAAPVVSLPPLPVPVPVATPVSAPLAPLVSSDSDEYGDLDTPEANTKPYVPQGKLGNPNVKALSKGWRYACWKSSGGKIRCGEIKRRADRMSIKAFDDPESMHSLVPWSLVYDVEPPAPAQPSQSSQFNSVTHVYVEHNGRQVIVPIVRRNAYTLTVILEGKNWRIGHSKCRPYTSPGSTASTSTVVAKTPKLSGFSEAKNYTVTIESDDRTTNYYDRSYFEGDSGLHLDGCDGEVSYGTFTGAQLNQSKKKALLLMAFAASAQHRGVKTGDSVLTVYEE